MRGLDYYTRTTFEFVHDGLGSQSAVGGGGRYDGLSEMIGGPALPSVGWALGVDRTVLALEAEGVELELPASTSVFAVPLGEEARRVLFGVVTELRKVGVAADFSYGGKGLKGAMKSANRSPARATRSSRASGTSPRASSSSRTWSRGEQEAVGVNEIVAELEARLAGDVSSERSRAAVRTSLCPANGGYARACGTMTVPVEPPSSYGNGVMSKTTVREGVSVDQARAEGRASARCGGEPRFRPAAGDHRRGRAAGLLGHHDRQVQAAGGPETSPRAAASTRWSPAATS